jgi:hypothetical protein
MVYDDRPKPCQAFPIDNRDLADVNFLCGYFFPSAHPAPDLIQIQVPMAARSRPSEHSLACLD